MCQFLGNVAIVNSSIYSRIKIIVPCFIRVVLLMLHFVVVSLRGEVIPNFSSQTNQFFLIHGYFGNIWLFHGLPPHPGKSGGSRIYQTGGANPKSRRASLLSGHFPQKLHEIENKIGPTGGVPLGSANEMVGITQIHGLAPPPV